MDKAFLKIHRSRDHLSWISNLETNKPKQQQKNQGKHQKEKEKNVTIQCPYRRKGGFILLNNAFREVTL